MSRTANVDRRSGALAPVALVAIAALAAGPGFAAAAECTGSETVLVPPPASDGDEFGHAVSVSGEVLAVGARFDDTSGVLAGAVYVYRYDNDAKTWGEPVRLTPGAAGDQVGFSVAVCRNVLAVGARRDRDNGNDAGAVYVYRYDLLGRSWGDPVKLAPGVANDQVGFSVAASGDVVVTGAKGDDASGPNAGAAYVYRYDHDARAWGVPVKLTPGVGFDEVGWSVAVDGDVVVVGAHLDDDGGPGAGAAYIYRYDPDAMSWGAPFKATPGADFDEFGHAVAVSGDVVVVGARQDDQSGVDAGAVYAYRYDPGAEAWIAPDKFTPAMAGDDFGWSVAASGDVFVVGAYTDGQVGPDAGAAYLYRFDPGSQTWLPPLTMRPAGAGDQYGFSIAIDGTVTAVGARFDDTSGNHAGAVYVSGCPDVPLLGDLDDDGRVTFGDLVILLAAWGPCPGCPADLNGDGAVTVTDLLIILSRWD